MKVALVTAASKGIGAAIARELHARGYQLALLARGPEVTALADQLGGAAVTGSGQCLLVDGGMIRGL